MLPLSGLLSQQVLRVCACVHAWVRVFLVRAHIEVCIHVKIASSGGPASASSLIRQPTSLNLMRSTPPILRIERR